MRVLEGQVADLMEALRVARRGAERMAAAEADEDAAKTRAELADAREKLVASESALRRAERRAEATKRAFEVQEMEVKDGLAQIETLRSERETADAEIERLSAKLASFPPRTRTPPS